MNFHMYSKSREATWVPPTPNPLGFSQRSPRTSGLVPWLSKSFRRELQLRQAEVSAALAFAAEDLVQARASGYQDESPGDGQVSVLVSIYQGKPGVGLPYFDPHP